ncbi:MAG: VOC family protein [Actinobacteria bacterium]|nr:VOC family protein [Actinomycetota bacterium]
MTALAGFHHVGVLTTDLDRLLAFYRTVFDAEFAFDWIDEGVRSALIDVGAGGFLHAFEVPAGQIPLAGQPKYQRGQVDHIALAAPTQDVFRAVRRRAMEVGATDGHVRDFGAAWVLKFRDPDGLEGDLLWADPDALLAALRRYADAPIAPWSEQA